MFAYAYRKDLPPWNVPNSRGGRSYIGAVAQVLLALEIGGRTKLYIFIFEVAGVTIDPYQVEWTYPR